MNNIQELIEQANKGKFMYAQAQSQIRSILMGQMHDRRVRDFAWFNEHKYSMPRGRFIDFVMRALIQGTITEEQAMQICDRS